MTMGHHLLLRSPKESLQHWAFLIFSIEPGGLTLQEKVEKANQFLKLVIKKDNPVDLLEMEEGFTYSSPLHPYCPQETCWS